MNINIIFESIDSDSYNNGVLDNALINSLKKFHTKGYRIDNPEWLNKERSQLKVPIRLDEISELDNYLDKEKYDNNRYKAMNHIVENLTEYLQTRYSDNVYVVKVFSKPSGSLFPNTYDLKIIKFYIDDSDNIPVSVAQIIVNSKGEYWTDNPDVII